MWEGLQQENPRRPSSFARVMSVVLLTANRHAGNSQGGSISSTYSESKLNYSNNTCSKTWNIFYDQGQNLCLHFEGCRLLCFRLAVVTAKSFFTLGSAPTRFSPSGTDAGRFIHGAGNLTTCGQTRGDTGGTGQARGHRSAHSNHVAPLLFEASTYILTTSLLHFAKQNA